MAAPVVAAELAAVGAVAALEEAAAGAHPVGAVAVGRPAVVEAAPRVVAHAEPVVAGVRAPRAAGTPAVAQWFPDPA